VDLLVIVGPPWGLMVASAGREGPPPGRCAHSAPDGLVFKRTHRGAVGMKTTNEISGRGPIPGADFLAQYTIAVCFDGPIETATFTVLVANEGDEATQKAPAFSKAKELARQICETAQA
jgi:hypothetical protein